MDAPRPDSEEARLKELHGYQILDTPAEEAFDDIVRLASYVCGTPISTITLIDNDRQWFKAAIGLSNSETPRNIAFCAHTILQDDLLVVPDASLDERFANNPLVTDDPNIRFYAGMPLITESGHAVGSLCVIDTVPRRLNNDQQEALRTLAHQVVGRLEVHRQAALHERLIVERERAVEAQVMSEQRFQTAFHNAVLGASIADLNGNYLAVNRAFCEMTGYSEQELLSTDIKSITHPDDARSSRRQLRRVREGLIPGFVINKRYCRKGGGITWVHISVSLIRNAEGVPECTLAMSEDITERKRSEELQKQAQERTVKLLSVSGLLGAAVTTAEVSEVILQGAVDIFQASMGRVAVLSEDGKLLSTAKVVGVSAELSDPWHSFTLDADVPLAKAVREKRLVQSSVESGRWPSHPNLSGVAVAVPLLVGDRCVGGLEMMCLPDRISEMEQQTFYWTLAGQCALALERARLFDDTCREVEERKRAEEALRISEREALERADRDPLTGLLNHRAFHNRLDEETTRAQRDGTPVAIVMMDLDNFKFFNDVYGHAVGDRVLRLVAGKLRAVCRPNDTLARFGGDEFALLLPHIGETSASDIEQRLRTAFSGLAFRIDDGDTEIPVSVSVGTALYPDAQKDSHEVLRTADDRLRWAKNGVEGEGVAQQVREDAETRVKGFSMLDALVTAVDNKDRYTRRHSEDVMQFSLLIARALGMDEREQQTVAISALLHDVGKVGVPDNILRKPGKLTEDEFEAVRQHPQMGAVMVGAVPGLEDTLDAVRHHHERWDGCGYPFGLTGKETPRVARLMAVADAFSAMTTDRPYRKGMRVENALLILEDGSGTQWDPECVRVFVAEMSRGVGPLVYSGLDQKCA